MDGLTEGKLERVGEEALSPQLATLATPFSRVLESGEVCSKNKLLRVSEEA